MQENAALPSSVRPRRDPFGDPFGAPAASAGAARRHVRPRQENESSAADAVGGTPARVASRAWWQAARLRARASVAGSPSAFMRHARRWSPGIVPPMLGCVLLLAALALATHALPHQPPPVAPQTLLKLFVAYLLAGTLYGFLLYFAASDLFWICLITVGLPVYLVLSLGVLWGPGAAGLAALACAALALWYVRRCAYAVPEGRLAVTTFGGSYLRTIWQRRTVLVPGEQVEAVLDASERRFTCAPRRADIPNELGEIYQARAAASVGYQLVPAEAHKAVLASDQWESDLHEQIGTSLAQALGEWGAHLLMGDGTPPDQLLAKTLLRELREQVRPSGIYIGWVSVRDIWLAPEGELLPAESVPETLAAPPLASVGASPVSQAAVRRDGDWQTGNHSTRQAPAPGPEKGQQEDDGEPANILSPDVLSDAYDAVRDGRITDPETIRQIANAFLKVAADENLSAAFPFDAVAAAHILLERAKSLGRSGR